MARSYAKNKGRSDSDGGFFQLPKCIIRHPNFKKMNSHAIRLLIDLCEQYRGNNNGDLCATWTFMKERGWKSKDTLNKSLRELEHYGLIVCTQAGGLNRPSLYAFSWLNINKASKESEWKVGDRPNTWKEEKPEFVRRSKKTQERLTGQNGTSCGSVVAMPQRISTS